MAGSLPKTSEKGESSSSETKRGIRLRKNKKKKKENFTKKEDFTKTILEQLLGEFKNLPKIPLSGIMTQTNEDLKTETDSTEEKQDPYDLEDQVSSTNGVDSIGCQNVETTL
ncbi:hypothetical protein ACH5RR_028968 [Cinchona calisaya]|uniref:Uncharacterized protein n=1 Tax=Cinchona calisaya TaxID=153742 RepID=A0ABD2YUR6_9GENT